MSNNIYTKPSYYALVLTGIFILVFIILVFRNYSTLKNASLSSIILLGGVFAILVGIHGLLHLGLETAYNYNPIEKIL